MIKVNRTRAKTVEVDEDASKSTDRTDDQASAFNRQEQPPAKKSRVSPRHDYPVVLSTGIELEIIQLHRGPIWRSIISDLGIRSSDIRKVPKTSICLHVGGREMLLTKSSFHHGERVMTSKPSSRKTR